MQAKQAKDEKAIADHLFRRGYSRVRSESLSKTVTNSFEKTDSKISIVLEEDEHPNQIKKSSKFLNTPVSSLKTRSKDSNSRENQSSGSNAGSNKNYHTAGPDLRSQVLNELSKERENNQLLSKAVSPNERKRTSSSCSKLFNGNNISFNSNASSSDLRKLNESVESINFSKMASAGELEISIAAGEDVGME